eukprot:TRINITY_DN2042_c0_g3_i4.p1 TRINITY_DN2042_c0_g3~~TRINITY_DN2042_c0_g3_i4.p1  ORF type:complete len:326 (+),score=84.82 TRINITY_DN2042_c0_g3_i4:75-1052(+)
MDPESKDFAGFSCEFIGGQPINPLETSLDELIKAKKKASRNNNKKPNQQGQQKKQGQSDQQNQQGQAKKLKFKPKLQRAVNTPTTRQLNRVGVRNKPLARNLSNKAAKGGNNTNGARNAPQDDAGKKPANRQRQNIKDATMTANRPLRGAAKSMVQAKNLRNQQIQQRRGLGAGNGGQQGQNSTQGPKQNQGQGRQRRRGSDASVPIQITIENDDAIQRALQLLNKQDKPKQNQQQQQQQPRAQQNSRAQQPQPSKKQQQRPQQQQQRPQQQQQQQQQQQRQPQQQRQQQKQSKQQPRQNNRSSHPAPKASGAPMTLNERFSQNF